MADVFISYSRRDSEFVRSLVADLEARGKSVWLDTEGIEVGAVFPEAIRQAIEGSDAFLFVITPESAASAYCGQEVEHALSLNKRVVPVLRQPVADDALPEPIQVRNWIHWTADNDALAASEKLAQALDTDLAHVHAHTRWLVKALDWDNHRRDKSFLLRGSELAEAESWLAGVAAGADPVPTPLQREFLLAGRRASARRQRVVVGASLTAVVVAVALAVVALISRHQAQTTAAQAQSRALAAESEAQLTVDPERSILLAMAAEHAKQTPEATYALRRAIDFSPVRGRLPGLGNQANNYWNAPGVAYSPDGKQLAEGSVDGTVLLLDAQTRQIARRLHAGKYAANVAYNPAGTRLAVGTEKGVLLLDPGTGAVKSRIPDMTNAGSFSFNRDGTLLAAIEADTATGKNHLEVWNLRTGRLRIIPVGPVLGQNPNGLSSVGFSPDGRRLVVATRNGLGVFDTPTGRLLETALTGHRPLWSAEYSPDGSEIVTTIYEDNATGIGSRSALLLDAHTLKPRTMIFTTTNGSVYGATFSSDGNRVALVSSHAFGIYSLLTHRIVYQSALGTTSLSNAAFSPDGRQLAVTAYDGSGALYRATGVEKSVIDPGGVILFAGFQLGLTDNRVTASFTPSTGPNATLPVVRTWSWGGRPTAAPLVPSSNKKCPPYVGVDPTGHLAYAAGAWTCPSPSTQTKPHPVQIWDIKQRRLVKTLTSTAGADGPYPLFNRGGSRIVEAVQATPSLIAIDLLDVTTGKTLVIGKPTKCGYNDATISDSGTVVAVVDGCGHVIMWRVAGSGVVARRLPGSLATTAGSAGASPGLALSPDAKRLAIANATGTGSTEIIDTTSGQLLATLTGHTQPIITAIFSPDGSLVATGSYDGTAHVWNPRTGQMLRTLDHTGAVRNLAFSPDSRTLATMDDNGVIRLWDACTDCQNPAALLALAKTRVTRGFTPDENKLYHVN